MSLRPGQQQDPPPHGWQERASDAVTAFCGDIRFVYVHVVLFGIWIATRGFGQDAFPFNFLTMTVSLEAIFLSTFILISQNRQQALTEQHNALIQDRLMEMLDNVINDEELDHKNEELIATLLNRIDVDHIRPIAQAVTQIAATVSRIEGAARD